MKAKIQKNQHWVIPEARVCVDFKEPETQAVFGLLDNAGFRTISAQVGGLGEPVVSVDGHTYYGLSEIRKLVENYY